MRVYVNAVGLFAPGLPGWRESRAVLAGQAPYRPHALPALDALGLPRNEARRANLAVRLALQVARAAVADAGLTPVEPGAVFACSGGDPQALDKLFTALALPQRPVSPNQFNNSVHNAPLGYWSIATGSRAAATSIGAFDASFAAGLLEACGLATVEERPILLVAYDVPPPPALLPYRPLAGPFGTALLLSAHPGVESRSRLQVSLGRGREEDHLPDRALEALRAGNPAARSLPLLKALAERAERTVVLPYLPAAQVLVEHRPC